MIDVTDYLATPEEMKQMVFQDLIDLQQAIMEAQHFLNKVGFLMNNVIDDYETMIGENNV